MAKKSNRLFPATDRGCDPVQKTWNDGGTSPSVGGGSASTKDFAKTTKKSASIPGSAK